MQQNGGFLEVASEPGRGSRFEICLPLVEQPIDGAQAATSAATRGSETVLLVEDEDPVRELIGQMLKDGGYRVLQAAGADEATEIARGHAGEIDLLVTDVVMPLQSGPELARRMTEERPGLQVLYISGHTDDALGLQGILEPGVALLEKPFTPQQLAERVREFLDRPRDLAVERSTAGSERV